MNNQEIIFIEYGSSRFAAIAGVVQQDNSLKILGEQSIVSNGIVKNGIVEDSSLGSKNINEVTKYLENSLKKHNGSYEKCSITVNAKSMKQITQSVELRIYNNIVTKELLQQLEKECEDAIKSAEKHLFSYSLKTYYLDNVKTEEPLEKRGFKIRADFRVVVGDKLVQDKVEGMFQRTGVAVDYIHLGINALSMALLRDEEKENGCAIISFGATTTTLGVYKDGHLQEFLIVPFGGRNITKDIEASGIGFEYAEKLKCKTGYCMEKLVEKPMKIKIPLIEKPEESIVISISFLSQIIEARLEEILTPIFDVLDNLSFSLDSGIVITGGGAKLNGIEEFLIDKTGFKVAIGSHSDWLSDDTDEKFYDPIYSQIIGGILLTHELREISAGEEMDEIPPVIPSSKIKRITQKVGSSFSKGAQLFFNYDDLEKEQNKQNKL